MTIKYLGMRVSNAFVCPRIDPLMSYFEYGNETVGFLQVGYTLIN
jgi:hypothetical protein